MIIVLIQIIVLLGLIYVIFAENEISQMWLSSVRQNIQSIPLGWGIIIGLVINSVRKLIPPLYYLFPFTIIIAIYFGDKEGVEMGALLYQLFKLQDLIFFIFLKRLYKNYFDAVMNPEMDVNHWNPSIRRFLMWIDKNWQTRVVGKPYYIQGLTVIAFGCTFYWEEYLSLVWFATRAQIAYTTYATSLIISIGLEYFETRLKIAILIGALNVAQKNQSIFDLIFSDLNVINVIFIVVIMGCSTVYVHGSHIYFIIKTFFNIFKSQKSILKNETQKEKQQRQNRELEQKLIFEVRQQTNQIININGSGDQKNDSSNFKLNQVEL